MSESPAPPHRRPGRPRKGEPPRVPYEELDRLLVHGETVPCADGESSTISYPTYRDLALRYGVAHSLIGSYSAKHYCLRRREEAKARTAAQADQKLIELRSSAIALSRDDELRIVDTYLAGFEKALGDQRVRFDNPGDFNTMTRLKVFLQGGADSRQEVQTTLTLETLQDRHRRMLQSARESSTEERGEVEALGTSDHDHIEVEAVLVDGCCEDRESEHIEDGNWSPISTDIK